MRASSRSRLPIDAGQQVVEVVRDAAGQLPDRFHLLRLAKRFLGLPQRVGRDLLGGDVATDRVDEIVARYGSPGDPAIIPVLVAQPHRIMAAALTDRASDDPLGDASPLVGVNELNERRSLQLRLRPVEHEFPGRVRCEHIAVDTRHQHEVGRQLPHALPVAAAFLDTFFEPEIALHQVARRRLLVVDVRCLCRSSARPRPRHREPARLWRETIDRCRPSSGATETRLRRWRRSAEPRAMRSRWNRNHPDGGPDARRRSGVRRS